MALYVADDLNGEGLVWSSEVQIEVLDSPRNSLSSTRHSKENKSRYTDHIDASTGFRGNIDTPFSEGDADDEGSLRASPCPLVDIRGRPRSRTKQFRRRGIDLSRVELRISSRWDEDEKRSMENFRNSIKEKAITDHSDSILKRWSGKKSRPFLEETRSLTRVVNRLKGSVSRSRQRQAISDTCDVPSIVDSGPEDSRQVEPLSREMTYDQLSKPRQAGPTLRKVRSSISLNHPDLVGKPQDVGQEHLSLRLTGGSSRSDGSHASWQQHLQQDLQPTSRQYRHERKARYLLQDNADLAGNMRDRSDYAVLPSNYFPDYSVPISSPGTSLLHPSVTMSDLSQRHPDSYWRLPSLATSTSYHYGTDHRGLSLGSEQKQKVGSFASSREFDSAWWKETSKGRNYSTTSSQPVTSIASRSTSTFSDPIDTDAEHERMARSSIADLVAALKAKLAREVDEFEVASVRPLLRPSGNHTAQNINDKSPPLQDRKISDVEEVQWGKAGLTTSTSLPTMDYPGHLGCYPNACPRKV